MSKLHVGDYILTKNIPDQRTFTLIRKHMKVLGYQVDEIFCRDINRLRGWDMLRVESEWSVMPSHRTCGTVLGKEYTPVELFALCEE